MAAIVQGSTNQDEEEQLLRRSEYKYFEETPKVPSIASVSSLIDLQVEKLSTVPESIINSIKSYIGSGILSLPYGFSKGGWGLSVIAFPLATIVSVFCIFDLLASQKFIGDKKIRTYGDCGKVAFGNPGYWFVQIVMCIFQIACCCSYMLIITDSLEMLTDWRQEYWAIVMCGFMWLLSFIRTMRITAVLSFAANIALLGVLIFIIVGIMIGGTKEGEIEAFKWKTVPTLLGIVMYSFEGAGLTLPIRNAMQKKEYYPHVLVTTLVVYLILTFAFGLSCYFKLADNTPELIIKAISDDYKWIRTTITILLVIALSITFHVIMIPVFEAVDLSRPMRQLHRRQPARFWVLAYLFRILLIGVTAIPSVTPLKDHFSSYTGLVGSTFGALISFILPPLLHLKLCWKGGMTKLHKFVDILVLVIIIPYSIVVTVFSIIELVDTIEDDDE